MIVELPFRLSAREIAFRLRTAGALTALVSNADGLRDDGRFSFFAIAPVDETDALLPRGGATSPSRLAERGIGGERAAPEWIGAIRYDGTARWLRFDAAVRCDRRTGVLAIEGDTPSAIHRLRDLLSREISPPGAARIFDAHFIDDDAAHLRRIERALEHIRAGDIYQVNLARRIHFKLEGDELVAFFDMLDRAPTPFGAFLDFEGEATLLATSPELALDVHHGVARTCPMKGTRPRRPDAAADERERTVLDASEKEEAELVMVTDLHRNDLARVAAPGSTRVVGPPRILTGRTVHTRLREVVARADVSEALLRSMLPAGSVTGAPKARAMEIIEDLEDAPRGFYTGAYGAIGRDGSLRLAMTIRTACLEPRLENASAREGKYWTGGGIVIGSDPPLEVEETRWKAIQLASGNAAKLAVTQLVH